MSDYKQQRANMMKTYSPPEVIFTHGQGSVLFADDGTEYLDFIAGIAVSATGHSHPKLVNALTEQAQKLWHLSNLFRVPEGERLAQRLCEATFADSVFFTNSGTEAVECGLKMIRRYFFDQGKAHKNRIIGMHKSFHGRSFAAICAAGNPTYTKGFTRGDEGYDHVDFNDIEAVKTTITENTAGIIVEPLQGEGGLCTAKADYLQQLRDVCDQHDLLLMFDEVQCGVGRTGKLFAHEFYGVQPDIMAIAKGIGAGFPLGACLATNKTADSMVVGTHGSTFGGNPLATAVGNSVLDVVNNETFLSEVVAKGDQLRAGLEQLKQRFPQFIVELRGKGLMQALICNDVENLQVLNKAREQHLLVGRAGDNSVRLMPPLVVELFQIDHAIATLHSVFESFEAS